LMISLVIHVCPLNGTQTVGRANRRDRPNSSQKVDPHDFRSI
jgi:hypothetical protein